MEDSNIVDTHYGSGYSKMEAEVYEREAFLADEKIDNEQEENIYE